MVREQFEVLLKDDHAYEHGMHHVCPRTYEFVEFLDKVLYLNSHPAETSQDAAAEE